MISVILSSLKKYCPLDILLVYLRLFLLRLHNFQQLKNFIRNSIIKYFAGTLAALKLIQKWLLIIIANVSCCAKVERKLRRWNLTLWVNWFFLLHFAAAAIASVIFPPRTGAALCGCMLHTGDKRLLQYKVCTYIVLIISNFWCNPRALNDWEILRSLKTNTQWIQTNSKWKINRKFRCNRLGIVSRAPGPRFHTLLWIFNAKFKFRRNTLNRSRTAFTIIC